MTRANEKIVSDVVGWGFESRPGYQRADSFRSGLVTTANPVIGVTYKGGIRIWALVTSGVTQAATHLLVSGAVWAILYEFLWFAFNKINGNRLLLSPSQDIFL